MRDASLVPGRVVANPQNPQELLVQVRTEGDFDFGRGHFFKLTLTPDLMSVAEIEFLPTDSFSEGMGYSPDGRYIIFLDFDNFEHETTWTLLDQETGQTSDPITSQSFDLSWSPDGQWFVQNNNNYLLLHAPAYDYQYFIPHGQEGCHKAILSVDGE